MTPASGASSAVVLGALLFGASLALASAGCRHAVTCEQQLAHLKKDLACLDRDEPAALGRIDAKRRAYEERFAKRKREIKAYYEKRRRALVKSAAEEYHALLADKRATDPSAAPAMNPRIAAAADRFREAERRAEATVGPEEQAVLARLAVKRGHVNAKLDRYRAAVERHIAAERRDLQHAIALEERAIASRRGKRRS